MSTRLPSGLSESSDHADVAGARPADLSTSFFSSRARAVFASFLLAAGCAGDNGSTDTAGDTVADEDTDTVPEDTDTAPTEDPVNVLGIDDLDNCAPMVAATVAPTGFDKVDIKAFFDLVNCDDARVVGADWFISQETYGEASVTLIDQQVTLADGDVLTFEGGGVEVGHSLDFGVEQPDEDVSLGYTTGVVVSELPYRVASDGYTTAVGLGQLDLFCEVTPGETMPVCEATIIVPE